jgi:flagellum-specific peptidoglycan hydrolase FlgJ
MTKKDFFAKYYSQALSIENKLKINRYLILSQAYLESGAGESLLAKKYNNFFGLKANSTWKGEKVKLKTKEADKAGNLYDTTAEFRVFNTPADSFSSYAKVLSNKRFVDAGIFKSIDPVEQAKAVSKGGYATDPSYFSKVNSIIDTFKTLPVPALGGFVGILLLSAIIYSFVK